VQIKLHRLLLEISWKKGLWLVIPLAFAGSLVSRWNASEELVRRQVLAWESELSRRLLGGASSPEADVRLIVRVLEQISEMDPVIASGALVSAEGERLAGVAPEACFGPISRGLRLYSMPAGELRFCRSSVAWLRESATAGSFLLVTFLAVLFATFARWREDRRRILHQALEERLRGQQRIADLARSVAHDIRGPLTALRALAATSVDRSELLAATIRRIDDLAEDLLRRGSLSEAGDDAVPVPIAPARASLGFCSAAEVAAALIEEMRLRHPSRRLELRVAEGARGVHVGLSAAALARVLSNLLENALQASSAEQPVWLVLEEAGTELCLSVLDQGTGIPEDVLAKLGREEISRGKTGGHGLGVKGAFALVNAAGGRFDILSKVNAGTRVDIRLGRLGAGAQSSTTKPSSASSVFS
jgi:signal transduction histidine kinase